MKLSVIVPAYNLEDYIGPCLESLLAQACDFEYEVIVCNDTSTDGTASAIEKVKDDCPELLVMTNPVNLGLVATMARLLEAVSGDYIAYLDGDDLALPGKLQALVDYLDAHPDCAIVYHEAEVFDSDSGQTLKHYSHDFYNARYIPKRAGIDHLIRYGTFLQASSIAFRRHHSLIRALEHDCSIICDYPWHIMNAGFLHGSIDRIDAVLGRYRVHSNSFGAQTARDTRRRLKVTDELEKACRLGERFDVAQPIVDAGVAHVRFAAALYFLRQGEDALFSDMIQASANGDFFFDDRHRNAVDLCRNPQAVRQMLGWNIA